MSKLSSLIRFVGWVCPECRKDLYQLRHSQAVTQDAINTLKKK